MLTPVSKFAFGIAGFAIVAAFVHGLGSDGDLFGIAVFFGLAIGAFVLGLVSVSGRDALATADTPPAPGAAATTRPSAWPLLGAIAAGILVVGVASDGPVLLAGGIAAVVVAVEWASQSWSEHISGDPAHNRAVRGRVMLPIEIPVGVALGTATVAISISRVLLAVDTNAAVAIAGVVAAIVLVGGGAIAFRPRVPQGALVSLVAIAGLAVIGAGVSGALVGERDFEEHGAAGHGGEGGLRIAASEFDLQPDTSEAAAGPVEITYVDEGTAAHTLVIDGVSGFKLTVESSGEEVSGSVDLAPGDYTLFCDVPGHRQLGMEASLHVA